MNKALLFLLSTFSFALIAEEKIQDSLTTSVIIPCHPKHAKYLNELLQAYEQQTVLPDEIVISISESEQIDPAIIKALQEAQWHFSLKIILSKEKLFAAANRNIACKNTTGEILVCQDADDLPHSQRIEIIKYFFKKYKVDFLLHKFVYNDANQLQQLKAVYDMNAIEYAYIKSYHEAWVVGYMLFGQPAIHRRVFDKVQWQNIPIDEDNAFDNVVINTFDHCMMIHCPLYIYRFELSATPYELYRHKYRPITE